jgi:hypothetical protein
LGARYKVIPFFIVIPVTTYLPAGRRESYYEWGEYDNEVQDAEMTAF